MTPLRRRAIIRQIKDISIGTTLSLALLSNAVMLQSCGNNRDENRDSNYESSGSSERFGNGVLTYITENSPGNFRITDEVQVDPSKAGAIVNYHDGHRDTLSVEAARRLVQSDPSTRTYFNNPSSYHTHHSNGLANALLWGGLGYMIGRSTAPRYRDDERRYSSGFYSSPRVYEQSSRVRESVRTSRVSSSRPSGGRSGFFSRMSRGFSS
ncbi:hypothetical protein [Arsenicibacter rosenii]|uniref:UPF0323 domain-containing protein n=1 Tax=Arsenicibacter rosenii TaxID=1750698 RepID=A0A1S2VJP1_9BACT|nr:hypothetical protein [Arsenicibacter rosenii]OIN58981.1 hypothetical protein BLX24_12245 [Arsenicibacter rosenii]